MKSLTASARGLLVVSLLTVSVVPATALACEADAPTISFVAETHPDLPLQYWASGHLGVMRPGYSLSHYAWAFRVLQFGPQDAADRQKMIETWRDELHLDTRAADPISLWYAAYRRSTGQDAPPFVQFGQSGETAFSNCTPSAARAALLAIQERKARRPAELQVFVENQARVFSACSERSAEGLVPPPNGSSAAAFDDFGYQQAAYDFYTQDYKNARSKFLAITKKKDSAWVAQARLSATRCLIRSATLKRDTPDLVQLEQADKELDDIIHDSSMRDWQAAAWQLKSFCRVRIDPEGWLAFLVQQLAQKSPQVPVVTVIQDLAWLARDHALPEGTFTAWARSMQHPNERTLLTDALTRFKKEPNELNLVAALQESDASSPDALIESAWRVPETSAAYVHASYHAARLAMLKGQPDLALRRIEALLKDPALPTSARNLLVNLRLPYEPTWEQLYADALKLQAQVDGRTDFGNRRERNQPVAIYGFDRAGADVIQSIPTAVLLELAANEKRPVLKRFLAATAWARSVLLRQDTLSLAAAKALLPLDSGLAKDLQVWAIQPVDRAHAEAVVLMARYPGLSPLPATYVALTDESRLSASGAMAVNGWCGVNSLEGDQRLPYPTFSLRYYQPTTEVSDGPRQEYDGLRVLPAAPTYFSREMLAWAARSPADERVPEGLALAVRASRWGCRTAGQTEVQNAFQTLKKKFGKTTWAQSTEQYW